MLMASSGSSAAFVAFCHERFVIFCNGWKVIQRSNESTETKHAKSCM